MITTITTVSASAIPTGHNVSNYFSDDWVIRLSDDPEHMVHVTGTIPELNAALQRFTDAVRTAQSMAVAKRRSAEQNIALADRALGNDIEGAAA